MKRISRNVSVVWRTESIIARRRLDLVRRQTGAVAAAGLTALFGLVSLDVAAFFALAPLIGEAWAALALSASNFAIALALVTWASSLDVEKELAPAVEVRDLALAEIEADVEQAVDEARRAAEDVRRIARDPFGALAPGALAPLVAAVLRGMREKR